MTKYQGQFAHRQGLGYVRKITGKFTVIWNQWDYWQYSDMTVAEFKSYVDCGLLVRLPRKDWKGTK